MGSWTKAAIQHSFVPASQQNKATRSLKLATTGDSFRRVEAMLECVSVLFRRLRRWPTVQPSRALLLRELAFASPSGFVTNSIWQSLQTTDHFSLPTI